MTGSAQQTPAVELLAGAVLAAATVLEEAQDELCRLDAVAGDGDEGLAMAAAARAVLSQLKQDTPVSARQIVDLASAELSNVGGAMGAISYLVVSTAGTEMGEGQTLTAELLLQLLTAIEDVVTSFGGAGRGDKSIVDAIGGARDAAARCARDGCSALDALLAAAAGAEEGATSTAAMAARVGRASRLGDRSVGAVDAGAQTFALVLRALADTYAAHVARPPS